MAPAPANTNANVPMTSDPAARSRDVLTITPLQRSRGLRSQPLRSLATAALGLRHDHRQADSLRLPCLDRLDDRPVHAVCDLMRERDLDFLKARCVESCLVFRLRQCASDASDVGASL